MQELKIVAPDPKIHRDQLIELVARTFNTYWTMRQYCLDGYVNDSNYDWASSRIGLVGDTIVSHFGVYDFTMRVANRTGSASGNRPGKVAGSPSRVPASPSALRLAGIGIVATHRDYRGHGYMARVAEACVDGLASAGYDVTLLFGIRNFYHRFGYTPAWAEPTWKLQWKNLPTEPPKWPIAEFSGDVAKLAGFYNRENSDVTGTIVRPGYLRNRAPKEFRIVTWSEGKSAGSGRTGYLITQTSDDVLDYVDGAGDTGQTLRVLAQIAAAERSQQVRFRGLPWHGKLAAALRLLNCSVEEDYVPNGSAMIRTVNLSSTLSKISPVLAARLATSRFATWRGELSLSDGRESGVLRVSPGTVTFEPDANAGRRRKPKLTGENRVQANDHFARLIIGGGDPLEIAVQAGFVMKGEAPDLLSAMFPAQRPSIPTWDRF